MDHVDFDNSKDDLRIVFSSGKYKPLLDLLIHLADEQDVFTEDEIRVQLNTFVAAANDTTISMLQNILLALGSHPQVQERLYKE